MYQSPATGGPPGAGSAGILDPEDAIASAAEGLLQVEAPNGSDTDFAHRQRVEGLKAGSSRPVYPERQARRDSDRAARSLLTCGAARGQDVHLHVQPPSGSPARCGRGSPGQGASRRKTAVITRVTVWRKDACLRQTSRQYGRRKPAAWSAHVRHLADASMLSSARLQDPGGIRGRKSSG